MIVYAACQEKCIFSEMISILFCIFSDYFFYKNAYFYSYHPIKSSTSLYSLHRQDTSQKNIDFCQAICYN